MLGPVLIFSVEHPGVKLFSLDSPQSNKEDRNVVPSGLEKVWPDRAQLASMVSCKLICAMYVICASICVKWMNHAGLIYF